MAIDKNAVIKEAQKFAAKGQYDKAIAEWKKLIKESPNDANIFNTIGDLSLKKNAKADAVDAYKKAADLLAADGFTSKAIALYKKVLNIDPKKVEAHLALGDLNADKGLTGNALESYKLAADHYIQKNEMARALGIYQKMADLNPSNIPFRIKLAEMYAKEGLKKEAAKTYLEAADVHMSNDAFQEARHLFEKVLALDPGNKDVYHKAGVIYFKEGKFAEACKAFKPAFEAEPSNKELADLYIDSLGKAGRDSDAEEVLKKLLSLDGARLDLREKLFRFYLAKKEYDKALAEAAAIADVQAENREFDAAVETLKGFVNENPKHISGRRKLSDLYVTLRKDGEAARELLAVADLCREQGDRNGAKDALTRALEVMPDMPEARERLERLDAPGADSATGSQAGEPSAVAPAQETAEFAAAGPAQEAAQAAPVEPPEIEEDPAIAEAFTEAEVLVKYGLAGKATEQLEGLAVKFPASAQVRMKLRDLYQEQGNAQKAVEHAIALSDIYLQRGMEEQRKTVLSAALEIAPGNAEIMSRLGEGAASRTLETAEAPATAAEETAFGELTLSPETLEIPAEPTAPQEEIPVDGWQPPMQEPPAGKTAQEAASFETIDWTPPVAETVTEPLVQAPEQAAPIEEPPAAAAADTGEIWAEAEFYYQQGLFDEARKYYEKIIERSPHDQRALDRMSEISREKEDLQEFEKLTEAVEGLEALVPSESAEGELGASSSDEEAVRLLMREIEDLKRQQKAASASPEKGKQQATEEAVGSHVSEAADAGERDRVKASSGEDFFDLGTELRHESEASPARNENGEASEDFFDLAAELREELSTVAVPPAYASEPDGEQSLDEIFEQFKKGVEEQAGRQDIDTHYNLGIAYKEMGLLDDAITEFMTTPEGEPKFIESRYMLGLCFMEKGDYHTATVEIQNSLNYSESLGGDARGRLGMRYDLGLAYQGAGSVNDAIREFQRVHDEDPGYRDVSAKLKELSQGEFISLDQLKEDIEKEISSKFLEEGERIEREEKTRKNEKVRN